MSSTLVPVQAPTMRCVWLSSSPLNLLGASFLWVVTYIVAFSSAAEFGRDSPKETHRPATCFRFKISERDGSNASCFQEDCPAFFLHLCDCFLQVLPEAALPPFLKIGNDVLALQAQQQTPRVRLEHQLSYQVAVISHASLVDACSSHALLAGTCIKRQGV